MTLDTAIAQAPTHVNGSNALPDAVGANPDPTAVSTYYSALQAAATAAVGSMIHGTITPIEAGGQGDFAYNYMNPSLAFNLWTFNYISALVQAGDYAGTAKLLSGASFPSGFLQLVNQIAFQFDAADQQALTNAQNAAQTQQLNVNQTYIGLYGQPTQAQLTQAATVLGYTPTLFDYVVGYMLGSVWAGAKNPPLSWTKMQTAPNLTDLLPNLPPSGSPVVAAVTAYLNALGPATSLQDQLNYGLWVLNQIKQALRYPALTTNAMQTIDPVSGTNSIVSTYYIPKSMQQIQNDLASASQISMTMDVQQQNSSQYNVSISGEASFSFGGPVVTFSGSTGSKYNMESVQGAGSTIDIALAYTGYSIVPIAPQPLTTDSGGGTTGWYFPTVLQEAYQNWLAGAKASTGFRFTNTPAFDLAQFPSGAFNLLTNVLISSYPTITINYSAGDYSLFSQEFSAHASGSVKLFGFIPIGNASMSTYSSQLVAGSSNSQFSVTFTPPSTASVPLLQQTAYMIGAVVDSPAQQQISIVEALLAAAGI